MTDRRVKHRAGMVLYGAKGGGSAIIEAQLDIIGKPYERHYLDWGTLHNPEGILAQVNPMCEIPTLLLPNGTVMTETAAITLWLGAKYPENSLVPTQQDSQEYGLFLRWLIWLVAGVYPTFTFGDHPGRWLANADSARELRTATDRRRETLWQQLETAITPAPWLLGERMTALDLFLAIMTRWRPRRDWFKENCPKLHSVATRVDGLPSLKDTWERNLLS
ncbi:glutathione S-transferase family protein [Kordiimonas aestuarii]|uniref:glutathione S-transferase family protein n=1 Tax=Kordiimonas aestuarii TaxID=1005925 RepID=UPI0021D07A05|nr:glutathione S-transferase family protein [Kordiimonas aestuarii]